MTTPLELIQGDLVGRMPVESVSRRTYGFVLMDAYSRASWVLQMRHARRVRSIGREDGGEQ